MNPVRELQINNISRSKSSRDVCGIKKTGSGEIRGFPAAETCVP
ncbi:Uncharacterized protein dnm_054830 [Desulfonema magnum]|uniref:Uncharacterized protein n=1 Tax=Desulfonema magnum TaxID=45655 RepID=A0A975GQ18_9BACT|nr:Uncharacterized protein dnm_054830 [Desulfonema magnum]